MFYQWVTLGGLLICLPLAGVAWRARPKPGATPLVAVLLSVAVWNGCQFLAIVADSILWSIVFTRLHFVGVTAVAPATLVLVLEYIGREDLLTRWTVALLAVEPVAANALLWTNDAHGTFLEYAPIGSPAAAGSQYIDSAMIGLSANPGPLFWAHAAYLWVLTTVCLLVVCWCAVRQRDVYRGQLSLLGVGIAVPLATSLADNFDLASVRLTEAGFVVSAVLLAIAVIRYEFGNLTPVARDTVLGELSSALLVVDTDDRLIDCNPAARRLFDLDETGVVGASLTETFAHVTGFDEQCATMTEGEETITIDTERGTRYYRVQVSPLVDRRDRHLGRIFLVDDVTEHHERQARLERQNKRLDRFTSAVSHDLRNPLQVADGHLQLAYDAADPADHLDSIARSHERMATIIDDVLTMAHEGPTIEDPEAVALATVADAAWAHVDTSEATFENNLDGSVETDEDRLQRVFENLFRNALEHGSPTVTVRTGLLATDGGADTPGRGFYVADDGPGIPEAERDKVFDYGYTDADSGTGLGLAIVNSVVEAHGWGIEVTESDAGGARFEITDVDSLRPDAQVRAPRQ